MRLRWALALTLFSATLLAPVRPALADPDYQQMADDAEANISAQIGRSLDFAIVVVLADKLSDGPEYNEATLAWTWPVWEGEKTPTLCPIRIPPPATQAKYQAFMRWVLTHEVWHCFAAALVDEAHYAGANSLPLWVREGMADWVAEAIADAKGFAQPPLGAGALAEVRPEARTAAVPAGLRRGWVLCPAQAKRHRSMERVGRDRHWRHQQRRSGASGIGSHGSGL